MLFIDKRLISERIEEPFGKVFATTACHTNRNDGNKFCTRTNHFQLRGHHKVSISPTFNEHLFLLAQKLYFKIFQNFGLCLYFLQKEIGKKAAFEMLVKLSAGNDYLELFKSQTVK